MQRDRTDYVFKFPFPESNQTSNASGERPGREQANLALSVSEAANLTLSGDSIVEVLSSGPGSLWE